MKHLLQFATTYNNNLSKTIECFSELKTNKKKRKKVFTLTFLILVYSIINYMFYVSTKNENIFLQTFFIIIIFLIITVKVGFFNFIILELFTRESDNNFHSKPTTKNKIEITSEKIKGIQPEQENHKIEVIKETIDNEKEHLAGPPEKVKLEIETSKTLETEIILKLRKNNFVQLIEPKFTDQILNFLLVNKIIDNQGNWISENLKRSRDVALFIGLLIKNNLLTTNNQTEISRKAKVLFNKNVDTGELSVIKSFLIDDSIPPNDKESYQYLSFLDGL